MPLILRKIRKIRWYLPPWLPEHDLQADALGDLSTKDNELSVWQINDDKANLERIIAALDAKCDSLSNFDYAIFDQKILDENNIKLRRSDGISADEEANHLWHFDLYELSALKIVKLARDVLTEGEIKRIQEKEVGRFILEALNIGRLNRESLSIHIRSKLRIS